MEKPKPNILFFLSDQHNASFMGCSGNTLANTPNLDALAAQGVLFENAYCQNPLCVPSRYSLLTGQYCKNIGAYENRHILAEGSTTIPKVFAKNGYKTCVIGKTHFNGDQYQGYQERPYGDLLGQAHQPDPFRTEPAPDSGLGDVLGNSGATGIPLPLTQTEICVSEAAKWLQTYVSQQEDKPFLLSVNFDKPHFPIKAPENLFKKYEGKVELPEYPVDYLERFAVPFVKKSFEINGAWEHYGKDKDIHKRALTAYYACVEWVDDAIGRILNVLRYLGLAENTMVIYASDHGEMAGEKGAWQKSVFFDASAKVPLIIRPSSGFSAGSRRKQIVGLIDLFPTLCDFAEIPVPAECAGISLKPLMRSEHPLNRQAVFCESAVLKVPEYAGCMMRNERWKYAYYLDGSEELYDMENDPGEWNNLAGQEQYAGITEAMRREVLAFWKPEEQLARYNRTPRSENEKHFYPCSNQFVLQDGTIIDARP